MVKISKTKRIKRMISVILVLTLVGGLSITVSAAEEGCYIAAGNKITLAASFESVPSGDDGRIYVYELEPFEYSIASDKSPIADTTASKNPSVSFAYSEERLYRKFVFATMRNGVPVMLGEPQYITNPEFVAENTRPKTRHGMKGLQGVTFTNLWMTGMPSEGLANTLPRVVQLMNMGFNQAITNPYGRMEVLGSETKPIDTYGYYMLNCNDAQGIRQIAEEVSYYAANSDAEVFIVGNEVNVRSWNYMIWTGSWEEYMRQYVQVFRVVYNAVKSQNANAEVAICVDCQWDRNRPEGHAEYYQYMDVKDFLDKFNGMIRAGGNIDWGVGMHPHTCPLTYAKFWDMSGQPNGSYFETQIKTNQMISFQNLSVITDYLQQPQFLREDGKMRYFTVAEMGISSAQGSNVQAASIAAAYAAAVRNGHVDEVVYLIGPQIGVDFSISGQAQAVFDGLDGPNTAALLDWAKNYIGIDDWDQVLR